MVLSLPAWVRATAGITVVGWGANQFAALLPVYREASGLSDAFVALAFGTYAIGLVPALFVAAEIADRVDRRWPVRIAVVLSAAASALLCLGKLADWPLLAGRLLSGAAAGAVLGPGTAWVTDLSHDNRSAAPRRVAVALSIGFGGGPLVAGVVAQWAPSPEVTPYAVHIALSVAVGALLWRAPDPSIEREEREERLERTPAPRRARSFWSTIRSRAFLGIVPLTAPWVFGAATMSFAVAPSVFHVRGFDAVVAGVITGITMGSGVLVQPLAQRIEGRSSGGAMAPGLALAACGMLTVGAAFAADALLLLPVSAVLLGAAYGLILVAGLRRIDALGHPRDRARLSAAYYSLAYVGFAQPLVFALVATTQPGRVVFATVGALVAAGTAIGTAIADRASRGHSPRRAGRKRGERRPKDRTKAPRE